LKTLRFVRTVAADKNYAKPTEEAMRMFEIANGIIGYPTSGTGVSEMGNGSLLVRASRPSQYFAAKDRADSVEKPGHAATQRYATLGRGR
jgi:hypothetical protein